MSINNKATCNRFPLGGAVAAPWAVTDEGRYKVLGIET